MQYLEFGNDDKLASCSSYTLKKLAYPLKHFYAVSQKFTAWN